MPRVEDYLDNEMTWEEGHVRKGREASRATRARIFRGVKPEGTSTAFKTPNLDKFIEEFKPDSVFRKYFTNGGATDTARFLLAKYGKDNLVREWQRFMQDPEAKRPAPALIGAMAYLFEELAHAWMYEGKNETFTPLSGTTARTITRNLDLDDRYPNPDGFIVDTTGEIPEVKGLVIKALNPKSVKKGTHIGEMENMANSLRGNVVGLTAPFQIPELGRSRPREFSFQRPVVCVVTPLAVAYEPTNPNTYVVRAPFFTPQLRDTAYALLTDITTNN